jgi:hypothetical protein
LLDVLSGVPVGAMVHFRAAVLARHASIEAWSADALRVSGWSRDAWKHPLEQMLLLPDGVLEDCSRRLLNFTIDHRVTHRGFDGDGDEGGRTGVRI